MSESDDEKFCPECFVGMGSANHDDCDEPVEGCPDCGSDTVVEDADGDVCVTCGWRP